MALPFSLKFFMNRLYTSKQFFCLRFTKHSQASSYSNYIRLVDRVSSVKPLASSDYSALFELDCESSWL